MQNPADEFIKAHPFSYETDPFRLYYHPMPPIGWMNDPNGLITFEEKCHLFYQHHPFKPENGSKYWGHMCSEDLVDWVHLPTALAPDQAYDATGCYSGTAIEKDDALWLLYTGHVEERDPKEMQCAAHSSDGIHFEKLAENPIIRPNNGVDWNFRDPKVWKHKGIYYCLLGNCENQKGRILLYHSKNLIHWDYVGVALEAQGDQGFMWECPDYFSLGDKDVLILSPEGMCAKRHSTIYMVGSLDYVTGRFTAETVNTLDDGNEFYAPQTFAWKGKRILIGWMDKWFAPMPTQRFGWAGAMTVPRELSIGSHGMLCMKPVDTLRRLCMEGIVEKNFLLTDTSRNPLESLRAQAFWMTLTIVRSKSTASHLMLCLRQNEDRTQETRVIVSLREQMVTVDKSNSGEGDRSVSITPIKQTGSEWFEMTVLVDTSSIELLLDGCTSVTSRIYPKSDSNRMCLSVADGTLSIQHLECNPMRKNHVTYQI